MSPRQNVPVFQGESALTRWSFEHTTSVRKMYESIRYDVSRRLFLDFFGPLVDKKQARNSENRKPRSNHRYVRAILSLLCASTRKGLANFNLNRCALVCSVLHLHRVNRAIVLLFNRPSIRRKKSKTILRFLGESLSDRIHFPPPFHLSSVVSFCSRYAVKVCDLTRTSLRAASVDDNGSVVDVDRRSREKLQKTQAAGKSAKRSVYLTNELRGGAACRDGVVVKFAFERTPTLFLRHNGDFRKTATESART